ncbi:MAG: hypothetical protein H8K09_11460 [Nitrospira sp.]|nr:hypothetical protein [Nitrospira sp.]
MMPLFVIRQHLGKHLGLLLSIAACAVVIGTQARTVAQRGDDQGLTTELGLESAWPHVRVDFSR